MGIDFKKATEDAKTKTASRFAPQRPSLQDAVKEFSNTLPLMEGREKGDFKRLLNTVVNITDFGFMKESSADKQDYVVFTIKEDDQFFYFGGMVLTDNMKTLEAKGYKEEIQKVGLPVYFDTKKSKQGNNTYTTVEFYPKQDT